MESVTIGNCTLWHGDCREILAEVKADLVLTDPPYGIAHSTSYGASWENTQIANDGDTTLRDTVITWADGLPWVVFGSIKAPPPHGFKGCVVWDKGPAFGMGDLKFPWKPSFELIFIGPGNWEGRRDEGVLRGKVLVSWESQGRVHPHQKPEWLYAHFMRKMPSAKIIFDPFMGSGTGGLAAVDEKRHFVGCEIDRKYFDIACERIAAAQQQLKLAL